MYNKMMGGMGCKCPHHWVEKILAVLMWIAAILFFWASWKGTVIWNMTAGYYFQTVIVLGFLVFIDKLCTCWKYHHMGMDGKMMDGHHGPDCKCGDCPACK